MERQELLAQVWSFVDEKFRKLPLGSAWEGVKFAFCEAFVLCGCFGNMYTVLWLRFFLNLTEVFLTLTEGFPCFFLSCKANARVKLAKTGHGPHSSTLLVICVVPLLFVLFCYCLCVNVYCHRVTTQLQLTLRWLMSYIYGAPILDVSRSHTTTQHSR